MSSFELDMPTGHEARVRKEAIAWYAQLCSGEATPADHEAWRRWHRAHAEHRRAWEKLEAMQATLQRVPGHIAASTLRAAGAARTDRRRLLRGVALVASGGALGYLSWQVADGGGGWPALLADHRTGTGEQRSIDLADGSSLLLNTRSAVDVVFDGTRRLIRLREGELLAETARHRMPGSHDARPFMVETAQGSILALGTRFTVRSEGGITRVTVLDDAVEVRAANAPERALRLQAGQQVDIGSDGVGVPQAADAASAAWAQGSLVVNDWTLQEVVAELARYRRGRLACDPAVANLKVSGAFPIHDTDRALSVIARSFPVRVASLTRYWVSLVPA